MQARRVHSVSAASIVSGFIPASWTRGRRGSSRAGAIDRARRPADTCGIHGPRRNRLSPRRFLVAVLAILPLLARASDADTPAERAAVLYRRALVHIGQNTTDTRRLAMGELEDATRLVPNEPEYEITLARLYFQYGFLKQARVRFERVVALAPDDFDARLGLGRVWERDWLKFLEPRSLQLACVSF